MCDSLKRRKESGEREANSILLRPATRRVSVASVSLVTSGQ